jgi:hypothetical protein
MAVERRSEVGYTQPKSSVTRAKRDLKVMFGMVLMMAKSTRKE